MHTSCIQQHGLSLSLSLNFSCRALITHVTSFQPTGAEKRALETG